MRSVWKGHYYKNNKFLDKSSTLFNTMIKKKFLVNDNKSNTFFLVERHMVGLKLGEFIFSRKVGVTHKKKVLNKRKK